MSKSGTNSQAASRPAMRSSRATGQGGKKGCWLTLTRWAIELGLDPKTLAVRLKENGHGIERKALYSVRQVVTSVYGDREVESIKAMKLDNAERERKAAEEAGDLVRLAAVEKLLAELVTLPLRQVLLSAPTTLDVRCNPSDPELAREAIQHWVDNEVLKLLREKLSE